MKKQYLIKTLLIASCLSVSFAKENDTKEGELFIENAPTVLQGTNFTDTSNILNAVQFDIKPEEIREMKMKQEEILKAQEQKLVDYKGSMKKVVYKNGFVDITLRMGFATLVSFKDEFGNNLVIDTFAIGENNINLQKTGDNQLILTPTKKWFSTNMIVMINGYDKPIHIKISEALTDIPDTELNILIPSAFETTPKNNQDTYTESIQLKRKITMELLKNGEIINSEKITFKALNLATGKQIENMDLFSQVRFFQVQRKNKKFLIAELDNRYTIVGNSYGNFSRYNNSKSIYFLEPNTNILVITNKKNDYSEDINFIEQKGFNNYNEFKRIKIILNK